MFKRRMALVLVICFGQNLLAATHTDEARHLARVIAHMSKHPPEQFTSKNASVEVSHLAIADLDGDGLDEVVVTITPHFQQSPTILIYKFVNDEPLRVKEGLAPGPVLATTAETIDSHTLEVETNTLQSIDLLKPDDTTQINLFVDTLLADSRVGMVVEYDTFLHVDGRSGGSGYLDLSSVVLPHNKQTCENLGYSQPDEVVTGRLRPTDQRDAIVARVGQGLYIYEIDAFLDSGRISKRLTTQVVPDDFAKFKTTGGLIRYITAHAEIRDLTASNTRDDISHPASW